MRVLVTGAFGTLGRAVGAQLAGRGHRVSAFDLRTGGNRKTARRAGFPIRVFWGDVRDDKAILDAVASSGSEAVIHLAAILAPASEKEPGLSRAVNVGGTRNVLEACGSCGASLIYASSVTVHGPGRIEGPAVTAADPLRPIDGYSSHKAECERMIAEAGERGGPRWSVLRLGVSIDAAAARASSDVLEAMFRISPETRMEYLHPEDAAVAFANLLESDEAWGRVLLVAGGERCRIRQRDLFDAVFGAAGIGRLPDEAFGTEPYYTDWMDTAESQRLLTYQRRSFEDFEREARESLRATRPLVSIVRPLARWWLLRHSGPWRASKGG